MVPAHPLIRALLVFVLALGACGDDGGGDLAAFCQRVDELRADDPFADLAVASPRELRLAFESLRDSADRVSDVAPPEAATQADRYREAVDEVLDRLRGAGFDLRHLDLVPYRRATDDYHEAATSLDNAATAAC